MSVKNSSKTLPNGFHEIASTGVKSRSGGFFRSMCATMYLKNKQELKRR